MSRSDLNYVVYQSRNDDELTDALQRLIDAVWMRRHRGPIMTIPVDELRDADCILMDGINELGRLRQRVAQLEAELAARSDP